MPTADESARLTRRRFVGAAGAAAVGAGALGVQASSSAGASSSDRMNVLLLIIDSVRSDFVSSYGSRLAETPNIDELINQGVRFTRFFPEAMPTVPARRTIMTGRRVFPFRGWERAPDLGRGPGAAPIEDVRTTFTSALSRAGYWTGSVSDNPFVGFTRSWRPFRLTFDRYVSVVGHSGFRGDPESVTDEQLEHWLPEGLADDDRYVDGMRKYLANTGAGEDDSQSNSARVFGEASKLLDEAKDNQPFALVVDSFDPHEPWSPTPEFVRKYADPDYRGPNPGTARYTRWETYLDRDELRQMRAVYAAALTITDKWLGEFLGRFRELGLHESTAIVMLSDHGILLGDRGWTGKIAQELHPELIQVPCVIIHPDRKSAGVSSQYLASTHDVAPTLLTLAGVPVPRGMDGHDLSPLLDDEQPPERPYQYGGYFNHFYVRTDFWSFVADNRGINRELYDLTLDPAEMNNVADRNRDVHGELYARLLERIGGPAPFYSGEAVEPVKR
ncbi:MAG TPA: sulfatase [Thermoleophilaceae bacterium]|nr:sulfatase [Thermoleophilaceae bacterium]